MFLRGVNGAHIFYPVVMAVQYEDPVDAAGGVGSVVDGQTLNAVALDRQTVVPPGLRGVTARNVRHSNSRRDANGPRSRTGNGGYLDRLDLDRKSTRLNSSHD